MPSDTQRAPVIAVALKQRAQGTGWALMLRGILALVLGVSALIWPRLTLGLLIQFTGFYVLLDGAASLISSYRRGDTAVYALPALVSLGFGAILLFWPELTGQWLLMMLGILILLNGGGLFLAGRRAELYDPDRGAVMSLGAILAFIGLVLVIWPGVGVVTVSWLVAAVAIMVGSVLVYLALALRRVSSQIDGFDDISR